MITIYSNINRILASATILSLAILFSGCPVTSSPLSNCTGDHKGELDFSNLTDKTAHVLVTLASPGSGSMIPPIDIEPGDDSVSRTVQEGSYLIVATDKASGDVLFQEKVTVACGESNSIDITGKAQPTPTPGTCQNQGILGFANDTVEPVHIDLVGNPMAPSSVDLKALSSSILAVPVAAYSVTATGSSTGVVLVQGNYAVKCLQNTIIEINESLWGTKQWGSVMAANPTTYSNGIAIDAFGNVYVTGYTYAPLDGNKLTGATDLFVIKYNAAGIKKWTKQLGVTAHHTVANAIAADASGNIYVVGSTEGALGKDPFGGWTDFFITSYDSDGNNRWTRQLGGASGETIASAVAIDTTGNVYVAGGTSASLDMNQKSGLQDLFIASYTLSGGKNWVRQFGALGKQNTIATGIAIDAAGHIYVTGYTTGSLDNNQLIGLRDGFIINYNSSGDRKWTKQFGAAGVEAGAQGIATDAVGNIYITGYTTGSLNNNQQAGTIDLFIASYTSAGAKKWIKQLGAVGAETSGYGIALDAAGNIYIAGYTTGSLDNNQLTGNEDFFVTSYTFDGNKRRWTKQLGVAGTSTRALAIATDAAGNIYFTGHTEGDLDNNEPLGEFIDGFLMRLGSSGAKE